MQRWQDVVGKLDEVDLQAAGGQGFNRLQADESGTDHHGARAYPGMAAGSQQLLDPFPQRVDVGDRAQGVDGWAGRRCPDRPGW